VPGVLAVEEQLIADDQLELAVAAAIGRGRLSRTVRLRIRSQFGKVLVGGEFPSPEARTEALRLAAGVPGVVAVVDASTLPEPATRGPLG
jgi:osmotically-inducible protein OsmY